MANYKKWTNAELDFLSKNHTLLNDAELAAKLSKMGGENVTTAMVRRQRRKLNIKKSRGRPPKIKEVSQPVDENLTV
jgi:hypothetical protein